jgi:hypothetical protein
VAAAVILFGIASKGALVRPVDVLSQICGRILVANTELEYVVVLEK